MIVIEKNFIILDQLPMPPSANKLYATFMGRRIKSRGGKEFASEMINYRRVHLKLMSPIRKWLLNDTYCRGLESGKIYKIERYFQFHSKNLWTKTGQVKKMDTSNRIKAFDDCLGDILGFDDKEIWLGTEEKILIKDDEQECVTVKISFHAPRNREQLLKSLAISC